MEITLEMVDQVRERCSVSYEKAKSALEAANGNVVDAIIAIENEDKESSGEVVEKIKAAVKKGNVTKIRISKDGKELVSIPVTAGAAAGVVGLFAAPGVVIAAAVIGAIGKYGFDCKFELLKEDGTVEEILPKREAPAEADFEVVEEPAEEETKEEASEEKPAEEE